MNRGGPKVEKEVCDKEKIQTEDKERDSKRGSTVLIFYRWFF